MGRSKLLAMGMDMIPCKLICSSNSKHLQQIYTGFELLHQKGLIEVTYEIDKKNFFDPSTPPAAQQARKSLLLAILNDRVRIVYDTMDGQGIDEEVAGQVDYYFKRSFAEKTVASKRLSAKVYPLGLNYLVYSDTVDWRGWKRMALEEKVSGKINHLSSMLFMDRLLKVNASYRPRLSFCQDYPQLRQEPRILFMARTWDPGGSAGKSNFAKIQALNETRAECIRLLRAEFKERFFGGFHHDSYSRQHYPDCLVNEGHLTQKANYMKMLKQFPICIATTGLHGSIGWKFAEYIAFSKSIVSEPLTYFCSDDLQKDRNYLQFSSPLECVAAAHRLFNDEGLRMEMMMNNFQYYHAHLRPDVLVLKTLKKAIAPL
jgi:hypothetical protein